MLKQYLSNKWRPYREPAEYIIRDREDKILGAKMNGHMKACIFFVFGIIFTSLLILTGYF